MNTTLTQVQRGSNDNENEYNIKECHNENVKSVAHTRLIHM